MNRPDHQKAENVNPDQKPVALAQMLVDMRNQIPALLEFERLQAKLLRAKFLALVAEGFSEQQALELCKKVTA